MPKEPPFPLGPQQWSPLAALIMAAGPMPGQGLLWVFDSWDAHWWPAAADDNVFADHSQLADVLEPA